MLLNEGNKRYPLNQIGKKYHANRKKERYRVNTRAKSDKEEKRERNVLTGKCNSKRILNRLLSTFLLSIFNCFLYEQATKIRRNQTCNLFVQSITIRNSLVFQGYNCSSLQLLKIT